ncbi:MAG: ribonuclease P protein component [Kiritimatiellaeota bacterium]|nr:ribonuclease P protein component [Kiritimatiellota bacterium]
MNSEMNDASGFKPLQFGKATLGRKETIGLKSEFDYVRCHGEKHVGRLMLLVAAPTPDCRLRFGIICGKKYSKKAVLRNRARRLLKESFRLLKNRVKPAHCLFITRMAMMNVGLRVVQKEMLWLLDKAKILEKRDC